MTREELRLNNFEGFDRYLKTLESEEKAGWRTFYDEEAEIFTPPILNPETEAEYQLDHYAMWMVIWVFKLQSKPLFCDAAYTPAKRCYACERRYATLARCKGFNLCEERCPLVLDCYDNCGSAYRDWYLRNNRPSSAYTIAHLVWRETL